MNNEASSENTTHLEIVFPVGRSMRPFIPGGQPVWCRRLTQEAIDALVPGDILWFAPKEHGPRIHRFSKKIIDAQTGQTTFITRGDPMVIAETVRAADILGVAIQVEAPNTVVYSLTTGLTGILNRSFGKATLALHMLDRMKPYDHTVCDRASHRCGGKLFKFFLPVLLFIWGGLLKLSLGVVGLSKKSTQREQVRSKKQLLTQVLQADRPIELHHPRELQLIIDHELVGFATIDGQTPSLLIALKQKKNRQVIMAVTSHEFWCQLYKRCQTAGLKILPLKGLSLSFSIYGYDPSQRRMGDMDLLVAPEGRQSLHAILSDMGYIIKKKVMLDPEYQRVKAKAEYFHEFRQLPDIDVHSSFIVKKLFTHYTPISLADVFARAKKISTEIGDFEILDPIDEWLYLSYHFVLHHRCAGLKWMKDLQLLTNQLGETKWRSLLQRAKEVGLEKTLLTTLCALDHFFDLPSYCQMRPPRKLGWFAGISIAHATNPQTIIEHTLKHGGAGPLTKLSAAFWELLFIDNPRQQRAAWRAVVLPSRSLMNTMFNRTPVIIYPLAAPIISLLSLLTMLLYTLDVFGKGVLQLWRNTSMSQLEK
ncbi:MAG: nucleotidyltransferase family protein [Pseudomonadota bacterium]